MYLPLLKGRTKLVLTEGTLATNYGIATLAHIGLPVPSNSKTDIVVSIIRVVPIAIRDTTVVIVVVPRTATQHPKRK